MNGPISYIRGCSTERSHNDRAARREEKVWTDIYLLLPVSSQCLRVILCDPMGILLCPWRLSRQEYWSGLPCLPPGDHPNPGIKPRFPALQVDSLPVEPQGKPKNTGVGSLSLLQRICPTQDLNRGPLHCRWILYQLSYQRSIGRWILNHLTTRKFLGIGTSKSSPSDSNMWPRLKALSKDCV